LAGKRLGKDDKRGVLFFNSHEFIQVNKPRFFIFENVKGLLSDDNGKTFSEWVAMLGGKSVNGNPVLFPYEDSVPYHLYWKVLNAKEPGIPQNRERVFLVGIRDDQDNNFRFPIEEHLTKRLKDVLEEKVDNKYFLSEKTIENLLVYNERQKENERVFSAKFRDVNEIKIMDALKVGGGGKDDLIKIKSATSTGFEIATEGDSINFSQMNSKTRRGRVGDQVAQTLDTACQQGVMVGDYRSDEGFRWRQDGNSPCLTASMRDCKEWNEKVGTRCSPLIEENFKIRRLTPRECFRLMDFPDSFTWPVSDSQAYKQAGNSIVVRVLQKIINNLNL
jgi:DNA (cytosine-5)-methyltransferase 1